MNNQILFIYELKSLCDIFTEIEENLNFKVINLTKKEISKINFKDYSDYLILSLICVVMYIPAQKPATKLIIISIILT